MRHTIPILAVFVLACSGNSVRSGANEGEAAPKITPSRLAVARLADTAGVQIGLATLSDSGGTIWLAVSVANLSPGAHGIHVHSQGVCTPPGFESAGPHFNPAGRKHGLRNPDGAHAGDLPNLHVGANGSEDTALAVPSDLIQGGLQSNSQPGGLSVVIHVGPDDERTDPSGNSGARIACGVFQAP
ncbi:MAG: superoxide dismutase family protein [Gemmatimonadales bacterium]